MDENNINPTDGTNFTSNTTNNVNNVLLHTAKVTASDLNNLPFANIRIELCLIEGVNGHVLMNTWKKS